MRKAKGAKPAAGAGGPARASEGKGIRAPAADGKSVSQSNARVVDEERLGKGGREGEGRGRPAAGKRATGLFEQKKSEDKQGGHSYPPQRMHRHCPHGMHSCTDANLHCVSSPPFVWWDYSRRRLRSRCPALCWPLCPSTAASLSPTALFTHPRPPPGVHTDSRARGIHGVLRFPSPSLFCPLPLRPLRPWLLLLLAPLETPAKTAADGTKKQYKFTGLKHKEMMTPLAWISDINRIGFKNSWNCSLDREIRRAESPSSFLVLARASFQAAQTRTETLKKLLT
jgi:hypothetical protein